MRGRPKGSKNKPKVPQETEPVEGTNQPENLESK